jgi:hypothetical protein
MAEQKTRSPKLGKGTSQGRDQQQRADGKGEPGGPNPRVEPDHHGGGRERKGSAGGSH